MSSNEALPVLLPGSLCFMASPECRTRSHGPSSTSAHTPMYCTCRPTQIASRKRTTETWEEYSSLMDRTAAVMLQRAGEMGLLAPPGQLPPGADKCGIAETGRERHHSNTALSTSSPSPLLPLLAALASELDQGPFGHAHLIPIGP